MKLIPTDYQLKAMFQMREAKNFADQGRRQSWSLVLFFIFSWLLAATSLFAGNYFQGVSPASVPWPGGIVPYLFDTNYIITSAQKNVIVAGLREWELAANVKFIPYVNQPHYVLLQYTNDGSGTGYYLSGSPTTNAIMMLHGLSRGLIAHESGHLFGLQHEHQRIDRDNYIVVNYANVLGGTNGEGAFLIDSNSTPFGPYDLVSVMHYSPEDFSIGLGFDTFNPLPAYQKYLHKFGNLALSIGDRASVSNLYGAVIMPLSNVVTNTADFGVGSLRAAIYYANDHPGTTIRFNIPTSDPGYNDGVFTINLFGELPPLVTTGTIVDGTTQPGYVNHPVIALDGSQVLPEVGPISGLHLYGTNCTVRALAFDNFSYAGIQLFCSDAVSNHVENCYVGLKPDGTNAAPNFNAGVYFQFGAHNNFIGGLNATQRNLISGNAEYGVILTDSNTIANIVMGNYLGTDVTGTNAVSNGKSGVLIGAQAGFNLIGGTNASARNVISGNTEYGVYISDTNTIGNVVFGNFIGVNAGGNFVLANQKSGVGIFGGAQSNIVGGTVTGSGNVLSGNDEYGVDIRNPGTIENMIQGNLIGLGAGGTNDIPNLTSGLLIFDSAQSNIIGGTITGARNVISGNFNAGVQLSACSGNVVSGNYIGTDITGTNSIGNTVAGIYIIAGAQSNIIGGTITAARNIISGNTNYGVYFRNPGTSGNVVEGNYIGITPDGLHALGNTFTGVIIFDGATNNFIGAGNVVSGNYSYGFYISDPTATGNWIQGNYIGTDATGTNALPNYIGLIIFGGTSNNIIGLKPDGSGSGNCIAFNYSTGVQIGDTNTIGNSVRGNSIFSNGDLGIDLVAGGDVYPYVTINDFGDVDLGPNNLQNFPVITNAFGYANSTVVAGKLNSLAHQNFIIDVYRNFAADPSGYGEGQFHVGNVSVMTDGSGNANFSLTNNTGNYAGQHFTATATSAGGDTSEFSADVLATNVPLPSVQFASGSFQVRTNGFAFTLTLATNFNYRIQAATNLASPVAWVDLTNFLATNSSFTFTDRLATNFHLRFYRAVSP